MIKTKKIIISPDSFKGCLSASIVAEGMKTGVETALKKLGFNEYFQIVSIPLADGGEGMANILGDYLNAETIQCSTFDPLMRKISASYRLANNTAYIDFAEASGLTLLNLKERNPLKTTSYGTGLLIKDAIYRGAKKIILGLGGSATNDAGLGALQALGLKIFDETGEIMQSPIVGENLKCISSYSSIEIKQNIVGIQFILGCDIKNPLYGENGAAHVFAPQKGADSEAEKLLDLGLRNVAEKILNSEFIDISSIPGSGAAGGAGGGFYAFCKAEIRSGIDLVLDIVKFDGQLDNATLILTGEGGSDRQTLMGKAPFGILSKGNSHNIPTILFCGKYADKDLLIKSGFADVISINPNNTPLENALNPIIALRNLTTSVDNWICEHHNLIAK